MAVPSYDEARRILHSDREYRIVSSLRDGWSDWMTCPVRAQYNRWPRTRANMVFERVVDHLQRHFLGDDGVRFVFDDETVKIVIDERLVLRVKKANALGMGSNVQTQAVIDFTDAQPDLPGLPGLTKLEIVYELNELQTGIASIIVQARDGDMRLFAYAIGGEAKSSADIIPFPDPLDRGGDEADVVIIRPKAQPGRKPGSSAEPE